MTGNKIASGTSDSAQALTAPAADAGSTADGFFRTDDLGDGWKSWILKESSRFNSFIEPLAVRLEKPTEDGRPRARVRMHPTHKHSNLGNNVHGAVILALIDVSLFGSMRALGSIDGSQSVTLDLASQFVSGGRIDEPMDAVVELVRETGRLIFVRGLVVQGEGDEHIVASFTGTVRKIKAVQQVDEKA